jgi:hypothetical protein
VENLWSPAIDALVCLSVRSGLDLLLSALQYPKGQILVSTVTIRDMVRIIEHHGLVPYRWISTCRPSPCAWSPSGER